MVFTDKNGNIILQRQLAAIFAKANRLGIPESKLTIQKLTSINEELRAGAARKEEENIVIDKALMKTFNVKPKVKNVNTGKEGVTTVTKIDPALLSRGERKTIRSGQPLRVIDVIRKFSNSNDITHAEARRLLETSNAIPVGISDDAILQPSRKLAVTKKEDDEAVQELVKKFDKPKKSKITATERRISDAAIRNALDKQKELEATTKNLEEELDIVEKISDVQDKRVDLLQEQIEKEKQRKIEGGVKEVPLIIPGLISGVDPLKVSTELTVKDKIRRRALDIEVIEGKSPQEAMDQAKIEVVRQVTT